MMESSNLLNRFVCPHCGARGKLLQYLTESVCRRAVVTALYEHGVEDIDDRTVEYHPVDGDIDEWFTCAVCHKPELSFRELMRIVHNESQSEVSLC